MHDEFPEIADGKTAILTGECIHYNQRQGNYYKNEKKESIRYGPVSSPSEKNYDFLLHLAADLFVFNLNRFG